MAKEYVEVPGRSDSGEALSLAKTVISSSGDVFKELMRASMSNPLMGITAAFIAGATFHKLGLLTDIEWSNLKIVIFAASGIALTVDLINAIESILPTDILKPANQNITQPSGSVLVFGDKVDPASIADLVKKG